MYRDSKLLNGTDYHPISIANTAWDFFSYGIADSMGWINNAEQLAIDKLKDNLIETPLVLHLTEPQMDIIVTLWMLRNRGTSRSSEYRPLIQIF